MFDVLSGEIAAKANGGWVLHLSQNGPADIVVLDPSGSWMVVEVKTSRRRARARSAPLSPDETALRDSIDRHARDSLPTFKGDYEIWRLHRSGKRLEPLARESSWDRVWKKAPRPRSPRPEHLTYARARSKEEGT